MRGACAWACMRRDPGYRAAWAARASPVRLEAAPFPLRVQTAADLAAADWGLAVWEDPHVEDWRTPFLPGMPALVAEPDPDPGRTRRRCWGYSARRARSWRGSGC